MKLVFGSVLVVCLIVIGLRIGLSVRDNEYIESYTDSQEIEICKAAIATLFGRTPDIMIGKMSEGLPHVYYNRPSDGTLWKYKCKIEGGTVLWAADPGRWRYEDFISYEIKDNTISVYDQTANQTKTFPIQIQAQ